MASANPNLSHPAVPRVFQPAAGVYSYLVPGLGQILQGRVAKGLLFLVCIYTLFFYGQYLGSGTVKINEREYRLSSNVYLPDTVDSTTDRNPEQRGERNALQNLLTNLYNRPQFVGQFWAGIVTWPAIWQYLRYDRDKYQSVEKLFGDADRVQDADPDRAKELRDEAAEEERRLDPPLLGSFEREPSQASINAVHNAGDKRLELGWVFTVIAGVLNILVIYDAVAGPAVAGLAASSESKRV
jgi:hypothetical protein